MDDEPYYDLLPQNENAMFRVVFDLFTPRPHFIILPKIGAIGNDFSSMTKKQTSSLIKAARSMLLSFNISESILSIHRGSWKSRNSRGFHVHICVETEKYLEIFEQEKRNIPNWPSNWYVKESTWVVSTRPESYPENVRYYGVSSDRLFPEDANNTRRLIEYNSVAHIANIRVPNSLPRGVRLMCHPKHPKIGFFREIHDPDPITAPDDRDMFLTTVLMAMEKFANACGVTRNRNEGCHLCLYLGPGWNFPKYADKDILGYILTSSPQFYKLYRPRDGRRESFRTNFTEWFGAFEEPRFKCLT